MKGSIKVLKEGYGFIKTEETENDIFFHANNLEGSDFNDLNVDDTLEFEVGEGKNGKEQALNVTLVQS